ncbi:AMP-binding protein [Propionicimonas paludicola]|uniref:AMP-binding protein n=1 Tax=Propionicimonas paludicola TaxID=185243 RepID=UPI0014743CDD|nr:AMP-binding protein [Propionicimonas paludicola]
MLLRVAEDDQLAAALAAALAGGPPVTPRAPESALAAIRPDLPVTEPGAAAVVATSGSTGDPKAVVLTGAALEFSARVTHERLGGPGEWVCALPTHYVAGLMTVVRSVVAGRGLRFASPELDELPAPGERSYLSLVATQLHRVLARPEQTARLRDYAGVLVGGSAVPDGLREAALTAGVNLVATYGMSETCGGCVYDGVPLDGVGVELAQERIGLRGPMVFAGYRLRPELTADVLDGDLVWTNDRGRFDPDGRLEVLGRFDDVVISGGEKVDLAAAQRLVDQLIGPDEGPVVLLGIPDRQWGVRVVAVTTGGWSLDVLRDRLRARLGRAGLPKELRRVAELAYTSTGKIDRAGLIAAWQDEG